MIHSRARKILISINVIVLTICFCLPHPAFAKVEVTPRSNFVEHVIKHDGFYKYAKNSDAANHDNNTADTKVKHKSAHKPIHKWVSLGHCRVTTYCPSCNDPAGYQSSSGRILEEGMVACNWLENGTKLRIKGKVYTVMDYCGTDAIDIFIDTDICYCNTNCYVEVEIWQ